MTQATSDDAAAPDRRRVNRLIKKVIPEPVMVVLSRLLPGALKQKINSAIESGIGDKLESRLEKKSIETHKKSARTVTPDELRGNFEALDLPQGASIFVHTSLSKLGFIEGGAATVAELVKEYVVDKIGGTLAMPSFSIKGSMADTLRSDDVFDVRSTPSGVGKITEVFRGFPGVKRSLHPTHSVCALGGKAQWLTEDHHKSEKSFGEMSPLGRLLECDAFIMGLGTDLGPVTFYHVIEDLRDDFPWRVYTLDSPIEKKCLDHNGDLQVLHVNAHDPETTVVRVDKPTGVWIRGYITEYLEQNHGLRWITVGEGKAWILPMKSLYQGVYELMQQGITIYCTEQDVTAKKAVA
jgi:aminoglycoside 3-N-acetyltransferase